MKRELIPQDQINFQSNYVTTSRLAKLCGVSRFTIINWVKQNRIKSIRTAGGHRRIPLAEAISCLETLNAKENNSYSNLSRHCWEFVELAGYDGKCRNCLIYKRNIPCCFLLVREFGKDAIRCEGNCLTCRYFDKFFNNGKRAEKPDKVKNNHHNKDKGAIAEKKVFLYNFTYNVGFGIRRLKKGIEHLKTRLMG